MEEQEGGKGGGGEVEGMREGGVDSREKGSNFSATETFNFFLLLHKNDLINFDTGLKRRKRKRKNWESLREDEEKEVQRYQEDEEEDEEEEEK